jgi:2-polyprenyl-3-methyl-5-hydroxy-6-metoxy-1,4-benzoquinol methylase
MTETQRVEGFTEHPLLGALVTRQVQATPRHTAFLSRRFNNASAVDLALCETFARQIFQLAGDEIESFLLGYDFVCDILKQEEIYFRRHGRYRLATVQEAIAEVYSNQPYMQKYMRGLLMTQVFWSNHAASMNFYLQQFLAGNRDGYDLLEIGPGHGLLLSHAINDPRAKSVTGWDLSPASVAESDEALRKLGVTRRYTLEARNLFETGTADERFDAVVLSEVLEHLEDPQKALAAIHAILRPGGRFYINVPVNSPAPDHIFLFRTSEEAIAMVQAAGFRIAQMGDFPATNYSLEAARKHALTISACMVAVKDV